MLRWMFWEQYNHEPNVATLRFWLGWVGEANLSDVQRAQIPGKRAAGEAALALMDEHLAGAALASSATASRLADIALYAYTHVAEGGGFRLGDYPAVQAWLERVAATAGLHPDGRLVVVGLAKRPKRGTSEPTTMTAADDRRPSRASRARARRPSASSAIPPGASRIARPCEAGAGSRPAMPNSTPSP